MGERKCAVEGCNALEFRTSGFCLRHKEGSTPHEKSPIVGTSEYAENPVFDVSDGSSTGLAGAGGERTILSAALLIGSALGVMSKIIGFIIILIGMAMLPAENHWYGPIPGLFVMGIGGLLLLIPNSRKIWANHHRGFTEQPVYDKTHHNGSVGRTQDDE
jgi:hypothetical protein